MVLALTNEQLDEVTAAARHVPHHLRNDYLRLIAEALAGREAPSNRRKIGESSAKG